MTESLWTKRQVAEYLNINVRSVERLRIPRVAMPMTGKRPVVRFDPVDVRAWVDRQRTSRLGRKVS